MIVIELHYDVDISDIRSNEPIMKHKVKRQAFGNDEVGLVNEFIDDALISGMPNFQVKYINLN
jgi:hypothetical protein